MYLLFALLNPFYTIPALLFAILGILLILVLLFKKTRQSKAVRWIERVSAILTPVSFVGLLILFRETIEALLWGFYASMSGVVLALATILSEWIGRRREAKRKSPPTIA